KSPTLTNSSSIEPSKTMLKTRETRNQITMNTIIPMKGGRNPDILTSLNRQYNKNATSRTSIKSLIPKCVNITIGCCLLIVLGYPVHNLHPLHGLFHIVNP